MNRKPYNTDVGDVKWAIIEPLVPAVQPGGRSRFRNIREIIVELTYGWLGRYRRLNKDYEYLLETSEAFIYSTSLRTLPRD